MWSTVDKDREKRSDAWGVGGCITQLFFPD